MAWGLTRAARPTTITLIPKNRTTMPTPITAPASALLPPSPAARAIITAAATAATAADRRTIRTSFATIYKAPGELDRNFLTPADAADASVPRWHHAASTQRRRRCVAR